MPGIRLRSRVFWLAVVAGLGVLAPVSLRAADLGALGLALAERQGLASGSVAFEVHLPAGDVISHRADEPTPPASTLKLVIACAAIDLLGAEFSIRTELRRTGAIRKGTLEGDLIIIGRGDPAISGLPLTLVG